MSIQSLISSLSDADESERLFAADDLGASKSEDAIDPLVERLEIETSPAVCEMIILALQRIESDAVMEHAVRLLGSSKPFVRNEIAALLQTRGASAIPHLAKAQRSADADVRKLALDAAWQIDSPKAGEVIGLALDDDELNITIAAVEYLGLRGFRAYKGKVEEIARTSKSPMLSLSCIETLSVIGDSASLEFLLEQFGEQRALQPGLVKAVGALGSSKQNVFLEGLAVDPADAGSIIEALASLCRRGELTRLSPFWIDRLASWSQHDSSPGSQGLCFRLLELFPHQSEATSLAARLRSADH